MRIQRIENTYEGMPRYAVERDGRRLGTVEKSRDSGLWFAYLRSTQRLNYVGRRTRQQAVAAVLAAAAVGL